MSARFDTTQWSQVLLAGGRNDADGQAALEALCEAYWYPLYAYARRQGLDVEMARDRTQGFFIHLLESDLLRVADPGRGRFRSFLLTSFKNFLSHEREKSAALKRGGGTKTVSLDADDAETRFGLEPVESLTPDLLYERRWALTLMERAMNALEAEAGSPERFRRLRSYLTGSDAQLPYKEAAAELGMSEAAVRVAVHRLRARYGELLRAEITATVADPNEVDEELKHLLTVVDPESDSPE